MAHGFLSYQDTRGEVDYLGGIINAVKKYLDNREKKEKVADIVASKIEIEGQKQLKGAKEVPSIHGTKQKLLTGGSFSRLLSSPQLPGAPGSGAVNATVMGGALANIGFAGQPLKPDSFVSDQVIDVTAKTMAYGTEEIVQAVDRLTFVNIQLLAAVRQQTALVNRDITRQRARNEENLLEKTIDSSGNTSYRRLINVTPTGGNASGTGGGSRKDMGDFMKTAVRRGLNPNNVKGAQAISKGAHYGAIKLAQMGAKSPLNALKAARMMPEVAENASKLLFGTTKAAPIIKTALGTSKIAAKTSAKTLTTAATAGEMAAKGAKSKIASKAAADVGEFFIEGGVRQASKVAPAKILARLVDEGVPKKEAVKIVADQFDADAANQLVKASAKKSTGAAKVAAGLAKPGAKALGKSVLKKIPVIAGLAGIVFGVQRALEGDFLGAGLEIASGVMGATGVGAGASLGIDGFLLARDLGVTPFSSGGIITKPTMGLVGETGQAEGVFPLEGSQGRKTFQMFGDAFVDAQVRRKKEVAQVQAEGLKIFSRDREYMKVFDMLNPFNWRRSNNDGVENPPPTPSTSPPPSLPSLPATRGSRIKALRNFIGRKESENDYRKLVGGAVDPSILTKSVAQLTKEKGGLFAMGRYQIQMRTANEMLRNRGIDPATFMFDQAGQDSIFNMLLERRKYGDFLSGEISKEQFGRNIAKEWAALPYSENNSGYYDGVGSNRSLYKWNDTMKFLEGLKNMGDQSSNINSTSMQTAMASMPGTTVINNTYVTGDAKSSGGNAPAAVPIGIGSRDTGTSAFSDLSIRTLV